MLTPVEAASLDRWITTRPDDTQSNSVGCECCGGPFNPYAEGVVAWEKGRDIIVAVCESCVPEMFSRYAKVVESCLAGHPYDRKELGKANRFIRQMLSEM